MNEIIEIPENELDSFIQFLISNEWKQIDNKGCTVYRGTDPYAEAFRFTGKGRIFSHNTIGVSHYLIILKFDRKYFSHDIGARLYRKHKNTEPRIKVRL